MRDLRCFVGRNFQQCEEVSVNYVEIFKITLTLLVTIKTITTEKSRKQNTHKYLKTQKYKKHLKYTEKAKQM